MWIFERSAEVAKRATITNVYFSGIAIDACSPHLPGTSSNLQPLFSLLLEQSWSLWIRSLGLQGDQKWPRGGSWSFVPRERNAAWQNWLRRKQQLHKNYHFICRKIIGSTSSKVWAFSSHFMAFLGFKKQLYSLLLLDPAKSYGTKKHQKAIKWLGKAKISKRLLETANLLISSFYPFAMHFWLDDPTIIACAHLILIRFRFGLFALETVFEGYPAYTRKASHQSLFYKEEYEKWIYAHKFERWVIGPTIGDESVI